MRPAFSITRVPPTAPTAAPPDGLVDLGVELLDRLVLRLAALDAAFKTMPLAHVLAKSVCSWESTFLPPVKCLA